MRPSFGKARSLIVVLGLLGEISATQAQQGFLRTYDLPPGSIVHGADATPDGGMILCGAMEDEAFVLRVDAAGNRLWTKRYSTLGNEDSGTWLVPYSPFIFRDVAAVNDSSFVVVGMGVSSGLLSGEATIARIGDGGSVTWASTIHSSFHTDLVAAVDKGGADSLLIGSTIGGLMSSRIRVDRVAVNSGMAGSHHEFSYDLGTATAVDLGPDGSIFLSGTQYYYSLCLIGRLDPALDFIWSNSYIGIEPLALEGLIDGSVMVAGDTVLMHLLPTGTVDWARKVEVGNGGIQDMVVRPDGKVLLLGWSTDLNGYSWAMLMDPNGNPLWARRYGNAGDDLRLTELDLLPDGSIRMSGMNGDQAVLVATDSLGITPACTFPALVYSVSSTSVMLGPSPTTFPAYPAIPGSLVPAGITTYGSSSFSCAEELPYSARGAVFRDLDLDGVHDQAEPGAAFVPVSASPGNALLFSDGAGNFDLRPNATGSYTLTAELPDTLWQFTAGGGGHSVTFTAIDTLFEQLDFGIAPILDTTLLEGTLAAGNAPCSSLMSMAVTVANVGTTTPQGVIGLTLDTLFTYMSANPAPDSIVGQVFYWAFDSLPYTGNSQRVLTVQHPAAIHLGDSVTCTIQVWAYDSLNTLVLVDTTTWQDTVSCAFDPNDKLVDPVGEGPKHATPFDVEWLTYTVRFQNTGTDTAYTVVIEDLLSPHLRHETLQVLATSHTLTGLTIASGGMVEFRFEDILLPDSNVNALGSQGFVTFRLRPQPGLAHLTEIENNAAIYFDLNAPVITNTALNTMVNCTLSDLTAMIYDGGDGTLWGPFVQDETYTYQWWLNGDPLPGATDMFLETTVSGQYNVVIQDQYGCQAMSPPVTVIITALSERQDASLAIFPNPMTDGASLICTGPLSNGDQVRLLDLNGRILRLLHGNGSRTLHLDRGDLPSGMYAVQVIRASGSVGSVRLVLE